ncbi:protein CAJ1-like isoform X5 [Pistacia vera]|uniref:protein CAJ1-like isoform X5 n=1 Tax=Pistacia vera TaxID=55513 RepID=UPI001262FCDD|nr:protein CAJ1-like isoform X5 [Pistacia vera]
MHGDEARVLLGFPPNYRPTLSQVKAAYRRKVWESHPDLFPLDKKPHAESKFKLISEAYTCLLSDQASFDAFEVYIRASSTFASHATDDLHLSSLSNRKIHSK